MGASQRESCMCVQHSPHIPCPQMTSYTLLHTDRHTQLGLQNDKVRYKCCCSLVKLCEDCDDMFWSCSELCMAEVVMIEMSC